MFLLLDLPAFTRDFTRDKATELVGMEPCTQETRLGAYIANAPKPYGFYTGNS